MTGKKTAAKGEHDPKTGDQAEVSPPAAEAEQRSVNPPLQTVEEYQSVAADAEFVAGQTVEPDFGHAEDERGQAADRGHLDSRRL